MKKLLLAIFLLLPIVGFSQSDGTVSTVRTRGSNPGSCATTAGVIFWDTAGLHFAGCSATNTIGHVPWIDQTNGWSALQDFSGGLFKPPLKTVGTLPTASTSTNLVFVITDGTSASDCVTGGGSTRSLCVSNGTSWVPLGGGGGVSGSSLASGQLIVGAGGSSIQVGNLSGDATTSGGTAVTVAKVNGVTYGTSPSTNTVPVVTSANTVTYETVPNAALLNSSVTVNTASPLGGGGVLALGGTLSLTCSSCNNGGINAKTVNYTLAASDDGELVSFNGANLTATLPNTPPSAVWVATILNLNSTSLTISHNTTPTINGTAGNITLPQYQAVTIWTDGTNYFTDSVPVLAGTGMTLTPAFNGLTIALTVPVSIANGGTGQTTASGADTALLPTATVAGTILYWNGTVWTILAGNATGTNFLQENASGVPSWSAGTTTIAWNSISNPTANFTPSMGAFVSTFNTTSAVADFFSWRNTTAAATGANQSSPINSLCGRTFSGSTPADTLDCWRLQNNPSATTNNPVPTFVISYSGSSTASPVVQVPAVQTTATTQGMIGLTASTTAPASFPPANTFGWLAPNAASIATPFYFQPSSTTGPAATGPMLVGAVASNISAITYGTMSNSANSKFATTTGTLTNGDLASWNASGDVIDASIVAANVTTNSTSGTTNAIPKWSAAHTLTNSTISDNGTLISTTESIDLGSNAIITDIANNGTTAPTANKFVKLTGAPSTVTVSASSADNVIGICVGNCATTGNAQIATSGQVSCVFDNGTTAGDYVQISSVGGCHDAGSTFPTSGGDVKGRILSTNAAAGTYNIVLFPPEISASAAGGGYNTIQSNGSAITQRNTVNFISGTNATVSCVDNAGSTRSDCTISASSAAGSRLDQITAATATNTISNLDNAQIWNWSISTASKSGFTFGESAASTGSGAILINIQTLSGSSASPLQVTAAGTANGVKMGASNGVLGQIGTGGFGIGSTTHGVLVSEGTTTAAVATAAGSTNQVLKSGGSSSDPSYADLRDIHKIPAAECNNATAGASMDLPTSGAPTAVCHTGTNVQAGDLQFAASQSAQFQIELPLDWDTANNPFIRINYTQSSATASQTIAFQVQIGCSTTTDDPSFQTAQAFTTTTTGATANTPYTQTLQLNSTSMTNCAGGNMMNVKLSTTASSTGSANLQSATISIPTVPNAAQAN